MKAVPADKTDPVVFPMTESERTLYGEWFAFLAEVGKTKPRVSEMAEMCEAIAGRAAAIARGCRVAYGQHFSYEKAREVIVLEAASRLIERLGEHASKLPKELKMALGG